MPGKAPGVPRPARRRRYPSGGYGAGLQLLDRVLERLDGIAFGRRPAERLRFAHGGPLGGRGGTGHDPEARPSARIGVPLDLGRPFERDVRWRGRTCRGVRAGGWQRARLPRPPADPRQHRHHGAHRGDACSNLTRPEGHGPTLVASVVRVGKASGNRPLDRRATGWETRSLVVPALHTGELAERDAELAAIADLVERAAGGAGGVLLVEGPAGVGKTRLLQAAVQLADRRALTVLEARGGELEQSFPFGIAAQLLGRAVAALDAPERAAMLSGAAALAVDLVDPGAAAATDAPAATSHEALYARLHGLYWLCAGLAAEEPLLLVVDDAHWADEPSLQWLLFMARRLGDMPITLLLGARLAAGGAWPEPLALLGDERNASRLRPRALSEARLPDRARAAARHRRGRGVRRGLPSGQRREPVLDLRARRRAEGRRDQADRCRRGTDRVAGTGGPRPQRARPAQPVATRDRGSGALRRRARRRSRASSCGDAGRPRRRGGRRGRGCPRRRRAAGPGPPAPDRPSPGAHGPVRRVAQRGAGRAACASSAHARAGGRRPRRDRRAPRSPPSLASRPRRPSFCSRRPNAPWPAARRPRRRPTCGERWPNRRRRPSAARSSAASASSRPGSATRRRPSTCARRCG